MKPDRKVVEGDVFRFSDTKEGWGCGQILISGTILFVAVFDPVFEDTNKLSLSDIVQSRVLLAGWTMDARIRSGSWEMIGNISDKPSIPLPEYKVGMAGTVWVTDVRGRLLREASPDEDARLRYKSSHSPIAYEKAFSAFHSGEWRDRYTPLLAPNS